MASVKNMLAAFVIFNKYEPNGDVSAEHDELWAGSEKTHKEATPEELQVIDDAGWFWDENMESFHRFT